jgi:hypothetical protein
MPKKPLPVPTILLLLSLSGPLCARDIDGEYAVFGAGGENCAGYLVAQERGGTAARWFTDWLAGYLSAVNNAGSGTYNILGQRTFADILAWLEGYCSVNPEMNFTNAAADMTSVLYDERANLAPDKQSNWGKFAETAE